MYSSLFKFSLLKMGFCLTVSGDVEFDKICQVLDVGRKSLDLIVAQAKLPKTVQSEEIL